MAIDKVTVNLYTCCKCQYRWLGGWDSDSNKERHIPFYCPKCKNLRWNHEYIEEEDALFDKVKEEHTIERVRKESEFMRLMSQIKNAGAETNIMVTTSYIDFIAYNFLYKIDPQPDMFELKQLLATPKKNIEARHEYMLSIISDRIENADKYEKERFSKYGDSYLWYSDHDKRYHSDEPLGQPRLQSEKKIKGCRHTTQEVQKLEKLISQRKEQRRKEIEKKWSSQ